MSFKKVKELPLYSERRTRIQWVLFSSGGIRKKAQFFRLDHPKLEHILFHGISRVTFHDGLCKTTILSLSWFTKFWNVVVDNFLKVESVALLKAIELQCRENFFTFAVGSTISRSLIVRRCLRNCDGGNFASGANWGTNGLSLLKWLGISKLTAQDNQENANCFRFSPEIVI